MSKSTKGLKRNGLRSWIVPSQTSRSIIIERERPRHFRIRPVDMPPAFYYAEYRLLRAARQHAEELAALDNYPCPELPLCLRRWKP